MLNSASVSASRSAPRSGLRREEFGSKSKTKKKQKKKRHLYLVFFTPRLAGGHADGRSDGDGSERQRVDDFPERLFQ